MSFKECANCGYPMDEVECRGMDEDKNGRMVIGGYALVPVGLIEEINKISEDIGRFYENKD